MALMWGLVQLTVTVTLLLGKSGHTTSRYILTIKARVTNEINILWVPSAVTVTPHFALCALDVPTHLS
jgi:hypothetical protein